MKERERLRSLAHHAVLEAKAAGGRKRRIKRAEPDHAARCIRRGPSSTKVKGGQDAMPMPGAGTRLGRAKQEYIQLAAQQRAKQFLYDHGRAVSPKVTSSDLENGVATSIVVPDRNGLPRLKSIKLAPRASAWVNPVPKRK